MFPAAILAGGLATRLRPVTDTIPKSLIEINGEPFVAHQLRLLHSRGIHRAVLCVGYLGERIRDFLGNGSAFGVEVEYSFDGPVLRGTGGAIQQALPRLGDSFFVIYGDSYLPCDYAAVQASFEAGGKPGLMTVFRNQGQWDTSNVEFEKGRILAYDKCLRSPRMQYIDYGLGLFRRQAFAEVAAEVAADRSVHDLGGIYQQLLSRGELDAYEVKERFYEIGSFAGIGELSNVLRMDWVTL